MSEPLSFKNSVFRKHRVIVSIFFSFLFFQSYAQDDYKMTSMDEEFTMEVAYDNQGVKILIEFKEVSQYAHAMVEKADDISHDFHQCAYIDLTTEQVKSGKVEAKDRYPRIMNVSYYRLRTVTKDGIERAYPPVRLPAQKK